MTHTDYERALNAILDRVNETRSQVGEAFPYYADVETGDWETTPDGDWCGGHWIGLLWLAAEATDDESDRREYERLARKLTDRLTDEMPSNTMFRGLNLHYAGFRGYDATGDRGLFAVGLTGADDMAAYFDQNARQIPLGEFDIRGPKNFRGPETEDKPGGDRIGAVDNVYTALPVLWRAYRETNNSRFRDIAVSHADRHLDWYIRPDGSTWHHAVFDDEGELERQYNELAHSDDTCWARGQGWNIAGLARAFEETGAARYLSALERTVDYYQRQSPADLVPYWDFESPDIPDTPRDTSAAALAAYGLTRLTGDAKRVTELREMGVDILNSVVKDYVILDEGDPRRGMVTDGCYNKPGEYVTDNELVWTDYYVAYALSELVG